MGSRSVYGAYNPLEYPQHSISFTFDLDLLLYTDRYGQCVLSNGQQDSLESPTPALSSVTDGNAAVVLIAQTALLVVPSFFLKAVQYR